jgi:hypothetical protein
MRFSFDARSSQKIREDSRCTWLVAPGQEKAAHGFGDNKAGVARSLLGRAHARCCGHWSGPVTPFQNNQTISNLIQTDPNL